MKKGLVRKKSFSFIYGHNKETKETKETKEAKEELNRLLRFKCTSKTAR